MHTTRKHTDCSGCVWAATQCWCCSLDSCGVWGSLSVARSEPPSSQSTANSLSPPSCPFLPAHTLRARWAAGRVTCSSLSLSHTHIYTHTHHTHIHTHTTHTLSLSQGRGAVFFLLGVLCLLLFDNDQSSLTLEHRIHCTTHTHTHIHI